MGLMKDRIEQEKSNKFFMKWDIVVYAVLVLLIVALFLVVFLTRNKDQLTGFTIQYDNIKVCEYSFDNDSITYDPKYVSLEKISDTEYKFIFHENEDKTRFNIIHVYLNTRTIECEDADCSISKDCTHMRISKMGDTIICVPHKLMITPIGKSEIVDPVLG